MPDEHRAQQKIRLDKWLWAARFFKTRALAKKAIEAGQVQYDGARVKVSKEVSMGACLRIRQGWDQKIVVVKGLSTQRRAAPLAQELYEETAESIAARETNAAQRKAAGPTPQSGRPDKRDRRLIHQFKTDALE